MICLLIVQQKQVFRVPLHMNKNYDQLPTRQSTKSIQRFKTLPIQQRVHMVSTELLGNARTFSKPKLSRPSIVKPVKKTQEELTNKIKLLQIELQRKLNHDGILRTFLKTLNNSDMSRIDIYLQLRKCEQIIQPLRQRIAQENEKNENLCRKNQNLQKKLQEKQRQYMQKMIVHQRQHDENNRKRQKQINHLRDNISGLKSQLETNKLLLSEVNKKNDSLVQQNKSLTQQIKTIDKKNQKTLKQLQKVKKQMQQRLQQLSQKCYLIVDESQQLKNNNNCLLTKSDKLQKNKIELNQKISILQEQCQFKNRQISKYKHLLNNNENQINELEGFLRQKEQIISSLTKKLQKQTSQHRQNVEKLETENIQLKKTNKELNERTKQFEKQMNKCQELSKSDRAMIKQLKEKQQTLVKYYQNQRAEIMIELKKERYNDIENQSLRKRYQIDQAEKEETILKLQNKINSLIIENNTLTKKMEEYQKDIQKCKSSQKLYEKLYCQNYKTAGRLVEIKKQISLILNSQKMTEQDQQTEQSLEKVTSTFAKAVYSLIIHYKNSTQKIENIRKYFTQRSKEFCNLLAHFKNAIDIDNIDFLIQKYIINMEISNDFEMKDSDQVSQTYHLIIQKLINNQKSKKFITQPSINIVNDSLDNVVLKQNQRESIQKPVIDKKYDQSIRMHRYTRQRQNDSNKQNMNSSNQPQRLSRQKNIYSYNSTDKQTEQSTNLRRSSGHIRSEIQRKYFRS